MNVQDFQDFITVIIIFLKEAFILDITYFCKPSLLFYIFDINV